MQDFLYTPPAAPETLTQSVTIDIPPVPPVEPSLAELFLTMSNAMKQMAVKIHNLETLLQPLTSVSEALQEAIESGALEDAIDERVEHYITHNFDIDDHIDLADVVRDTINNSLTISFDI
jgi:hypothetical protein